MASGLAALFAPISADVIAWSVADVDLKCAHSFSSGAAAAAAAAAARLAVAAIEGVLIPCKADAYAPPVGDAASQWGGGTCPLGLTSKVAWTSLKTYPHVTVPNTLSLLSPRKLMWLFLKNTGLVFLLQTNMWLYQALEAEEQAMQQGTQAQLPPYPDVLQQLVKSCWNSLRELLTALTRSEINHAVNRRASSRLAWKVLKDPRASLTRKAVFYADTPAWRLLPMYAKTMFRTQLPMYAAEFIVACAYDAVEEVRRLLHGLQLQQQPGAAAHFQPVPGERLVGSECLVPPEQELRGLKLLQVQLQHLLAGKVRIAPAELRLSSRRWVLKAGKNLLRVSGTAVCAAAGAAVAASLAPRDRAGVWAVRGHLVSDLIFANVLLLMLDGGFALVFGPAGDDQQRRQQQHHSAHFGLAT